MFASAVVGAAKPGRRVATADSATARRFSVNRSSRKKSAASPKYDSAMISVMGRSMGNDLSRITNQSISADLVV
jgi:hypothetical protein